jgi:hypothetical protein
MVDAESIDDPHLLHLFDGEPILNVYKSEVTNLSAGTPGPDLLKRCIEMFKHATIHRMVSMHFMLWNLEPKYDTSVRVCYFCTLQELG